MKVSPDERLFKQHYEAGKAQLLWTVLPADLETPVSAMLKFQHVSPYHLLFESVEGGETRGRYSIIALDPDLIWEARKGTAFTQPQNARYEGPAFESLRILLQDSALEIPPELPPMAAGLFGFMGYDMVRYMERLPEPKADSIGIPEGMYIRPRIVLVFDGVRDEATIITPIRVNASTSASEAYAEAKERLEKALATLKSPMPATAAPHTASKPLDFTSNVARQSYHAMVRQAKEYISAGDIFQVVPSRRLTTPFTHSPFALYRSLRRLNPSPYLFYVHLKDFTLVGSSPEILVRLKDGMVTIRPIAGTRKRGKTPEEDQALEKELMADPKERAEHLMLLDLGRNDVGRVSVPGSVRVTEQFFIERYSHVMHIVSNVEGRLAPGKDALDALIAGFPAGTLTGAPKIRAMEIIHELEPEARSFYGGTVGYFSAGGTMDTCIALRTGLVKGNMLYLQAGGGVVADSDPEAEFQETENKLSALVTAAKDAERFA